MIQALMISVRTLSVISIHVKGGLLKKYCWQNALFAAAENAPLLQYAVLNSSWQLKPASTPPDVSPYTPSNPSLNIVTVDAALSSTVSDCTAGKRLVRFSAVQ